MSTIAPGLATDISTILADPTLMEEITIASAILNNDVPIILDDVILDDYSILKFDSSAIQSSPLESLPILQPHYQVQRDAKAIASTEVDWQETPTTHVFKVNLPGVRKENIKIQIIEGTILEICGNRIKEEVHSTDKWHLVERACGKFLRRFQLPQNANPEEIKAHIEDGVLSITIPKQKKLEPHIQKIIIS